MGQNSSQLIPPSQSQGDTQQTQDSSLQIDDATMDDPATREDESRLQKKKRKISGDATRPAKKSKKDLDVNGTSSQANGGIEGSQLDSTGGQDATEVLARKRSKKRSKREKALQENDFDGLVVPESQNPVSQDGLPVSSAQEPDATQPPKESKKKRKRFTGRPSGLNLLPAGVEIPATQDERPTQDESTQQEPATTGVDVRIASPQPAPQTKTKKSKRRQDAPGHPSPVITNTQSSQITATQAKSPKSKAEQKNGASGIEPEDEEPQSTGRVDAKSPKRSKKRESRKQKAAADEMLPTPPEAVQTINGESNHIGILQAPASPEDDHVNSTPREKRRRKSKQAQAIEDADEARYEPTSSNGKKRSRLSQQNDQRQEKSASKGGKAPQAESPAPVRKASKKEMRPTTQSGNVDKEDDEVTDRSSKPNKALRKSASNNTAITKGPFTEVEKNMVDTLFKETLEDSGMTEGEFRESLKHWKNATDFKEAVHNALPNRTKATIRKFCQRRYHNLSRGAWTPEDDTSLKSAYAANPDKWTEISALVGRTPADCKDRWKNTVSIQDTQQLGPWSQEETAALIKAVDQCIQELKASKKEFKKLGRFELEQMLSWAAVSKKLNGARSAKRCNEKWQKLKKSAGSSSVTGSSKAVEPLATGLDKAKSSKKLRAIESAYNQCDVGDLYDILTEIHTAIPDHTRHFDHESTVWAIVSTKNQDSRFKSAMRRRGLYDALDVYKGDLKLEDPETAPLAAVAKALAEYLEEQWGVEVLKTKRAFWPDKLKKEKKIKSREKVESSDEDDDEVEDDINNNGNHDDDEVGDDEYDDPPRLKEEGKTKSKQRVESDGEDDEEEEGGNAESGDSPAEEEQFEDDDGESSADNTAWKAVNS